MTRPQPMGGETCPTCGPGYRYGDEGCRHEQPTGGEVTMSSDEVWAAVSALIDCDCGHSISEHNGFGCYARLSYEPLTTCPCKQDDNRSEAVMLATRLPDWLAAYVQAARDEERARVLGEVEDCLPPEPTFESAESNERALLDVARILREARGGAR